MYSPVLTFWNSYIEAQVNTANQLVISKSDASEAIMSSLSDDICSAKLIALVNQPEVKTRKKDTYDTSLKLS